MKQETCWLCGNTLPEEVLKKLGTPITELGLSTRALNCLGRLKIKYIEELVKLERFDLLRVRNMGSMTLDEIIEKVRGFGFRSFCDF
ncbi:MAG: hypothetical protein FWC00_05795 [Firmicutes bacterium]|nr:hypothetical protein [Bacillota bacterium]